MRRPQVLCWRETFCLLFSPLTQHLFVLLSSGLTAPRGRSGTGTPPVSSPGSTTTRPSRRRCSWPQGVKTLRHLLLIIFRSFPPFAFCPFFKIAPYMISQQVIVNDRWADGTSCHHGGYFNCKDRYNSARASTFTCISSLLLTFFRRAY